MQVSWVSIHEHLNITCNFWPHGHLAMVVLYTRDPLKCGTWVLTQDTMVQEFEYKIYVGTQSTIADSYFGQYKIQMVYLLSYMYFIKIYIDVTVLSSQQMRKMVYVQVVLTVNVSYECM